MDIGCSMMWIWNRPTLLLTLAPAGETQASCQGIQVGTRVSWIWRLPSDPTTHQVQAETPPHPQWLPVHPLGDHVSTSRSTMLWHAGDPKTGKSQGLCCDHAADGGLSPFLLSCPHRGRGDLMELAFRLALIYCKTYTCHSLRSVYSVFLSCILNYFFLMCKFGLKTNHQMDIP